MNSRCAESDLGNLNVILIRLDPEHWRNPQRIRSRRPGNGGELVPAV
jgi:hypothetical protein